MRTRRGDKEGEGGEATRKGRGIVEKAHIYIEYLCAAEQRLLVLEVSGTGDWSSGRA
jgi:hypothetical protein